MFQLAERWSQDCLDLKPNVLSILIGVNDKWFPEFNPYRAAAKRVAEALRVTFVPFQSIFDTAAQYAPPQHWAGDGVHPSSFGASLMAYHTQSRQPAHGLIQAQFGAKYLALAERACFHPCRDVNKLSLSSPSTQKI